MRIQEFTYQRKFSSRIRRVFSLMLLTLLTFTFTGCSSSSEDTYVCTITFDTDGGNPVPDTQYVFTGRTANAPADPSKDDYIFLFWYITENEEITAYDFQTPMKNSISLKALWQEAATAEYWQIAWDLNGGAWTANDNHATRVVKNGTVAEPAAPVKAGSTFDGWYKEAELSNKITFPYYVNGITSNFTLYAKWIADENPTNEPSLSVDHSALSFTAEATESYNVAVSTNQSSWNATSNQTWCVVTMGTNQFTVTAAANTDTSSRTATITVSAGNASNVTITVTQEAGKETTSNFAVGDYYYSDGSSSTSINNSKTCLGMIFRAKTATQNGLVVSLDETERMQWATNTSTTNAVDFYNGANNLQRIKSIANWGIIFPTFAWCTAKGDGWYMPAIIELRSLIDESATLNPKLSSIGAATIDSSSGYWSSTESDSNSSWVWVYFSGIEMSSTKAGSCKVRAIFAF